MCPKSHWQRINGAKRAVHEPRENSNDRGYDYRWTKVRDMYLMKHPVCEDATCGEVATQVHHMVSMRKGGSHNETNLQALCASCHSKITSRGG